MVNQEKVLAETPSVHVAHDYKTTLDEFQDMVSAKAGQYDLSVISCGIITNTLLELVITFGMFTIQPHQLSLRPMLNRIPKNLLLKNQKFLPKLHRQMEKVSYVHVSIK